MSRDNYILLTAKSRLHGIHRWSFLGNFFVSDFGEKPHFIPHHKLWRDSKLTCDFDTWSTPWEGMRRTLKNICFKWLSVIYDEAFLSWKDCSLPVWQQGVSRKIMQIVSHGLNGHQIATRVNISVKCCAKILRQLSQALSPKHQMREYWSEKWCFKPRVNSHGFQRINGRTFWCHTTLLRCVVKFYFYLPPLKEIS